MEKVDLRTADIAAENAAKLAELFPDIVTEVLDEDGNVRHSIDVEALKAHVGDIAEDKRERYQFTWPGKQRARAEAIRPISKTMRPAPEESVNWDSTENLYIEGDNLDALKILRETYAGKIKMIYIDPPYNTGHDFIYKDSRRQSQEDMDALSSIRDDEGNLMDQHYLLNSESRGTFHSDWCSMIYARIVLARDLLCDDGFLAMSIDDCEMENLTKVADEVFGRQNRLLIVCVNRPSEIASSNTIGKHEYLILYCNSAESFTLRAKEKYTISRGTVGNANQTMPIIEFPTGLKCKGVPDGRYDETRKIEGSSENIENFDPIVVEGGALKYPVRLKAKWRSSNDMRNFFENGCRPTPAKINGDVVDIYFENDRFNPQIKKKTFEKIPSIFMGNKRGGDELVKLGLGKLFDFPKSTSLLRFLLEFTTKNDLILDFFSGSATTAHAVMQLNAEDDGNRKFIMVQLPEVCDEKSEAAKAGYKNICEIGKERIRRAGAKIAAEVEESNAQLKLGEEPKKVPDIGFRVLKIDSTNFEDVSRTPDTLFQDELFGLADNLKSDRTPEDILFELLPKFQIPYTVRIEQLDLCGKTVYSVDDDTLLACFDREVPEDVVRAMAEREPAYAVLRDASFVGDDALANFEEIFKTLSPATKTRVV